MTFKSSILILPALTILFSCGGGTNNQSSSEEALSGTITVDGSSTVYPLTEAVAEEYRLEEAEVNVTVGSSGSGAGFKKFARGETDISNASRSIKEEEKNLCAENKIEYIELRVALDGIVIVVNKDNSWISEISVEELKTLWNPGSAIKKWSDLRAEWPNEEIHLYGPNTAHGTYDFFTEEIMGEAGASRSDYSAVSDYNVIVQGIENDKYALGYFGLSYYEENKDKLKVLSLIDSSEAVIPNLETIKSGKYSPLSRPLFIYISKKASKRAEIQSFVNFYLEMAGELASEVGYIPLPKEEYEKLKEEFKKFCGK